MGNASRGLSAFLGCLLGYRQVALDTNAVIYFLNGHHPYYPLVAEVVARLDKGTVRAVLSAVTELELLVKPLRENDIEGVGRIEDLVGAENIEVLPLSRSLARSAALMRARHRLRLADAIIVATAVESGCDALIGNDALCAQKVLDIPYVYLKDYLPP